MLYSENNFKKLCLCNLHKHNFNGFFPKYNRYRMGINIYIIIYTFFKGGNEFKEKCLYGFRHRQKSLSAKTDGLVWIYHYHFETNKNSDKGNETLMHWSVIQNKENFS